MKNRDTMGRDETDPPPGADARSIGDELTRRQRAHYRAGDALLGRYRILDELGQGGMGVVYRCLDEVGGIEVAVKMLPPEVSRDSFEMEEIRENFRLVAGLTHPNIATARTLEHDPDTGEYLLVLEYVPGKNLRQWRKELPTGAGARLAAGLAVGGWLWWQQWGASGPASRGVEEDQVDAPSESDTPIDAPLMAPARGSQTRQVELRERTGPQPGSPLTLDLGGGVTMELVWTREGSFTMGSPASEQGRSESEGPQRRVTVRQGFWMGKYELRYVLASADQARIAAMAVDGDGNPKGTWNGFALYNRGIGQFTTKPFFSPESDGPEIAGLRAVIRTQSYKSDILTKDYRPLKPWSVFNSHTNAP